MIHTPHPRTGASKMLRDGEIGSSSTLKKKKKSYGTGSSPYGISECLLWTYRFKPRSAKSNDGNNREGVFGVRGSCVTQKSRKNVGTNANSQSSLSSDTLLPRFLYFSLKILIFTRCKWDFSNHKFSNHLWRHRSWKNVNIHAKDSSPRFHDERITERHIFLRII